MWIFDPRGTRPCALERVVIRASSLFVSDEVDLVEEVAVLVVAIDDLALRGIDSLWSL